MADTISDSMTFGPQWLRNITEIGGASEVASKPLNYEGLAGGCQGGGGGGSSGSVTTKYKLAEHRYGREEMLALYEAIEDIPEIFLDNTIFIKNPLEPLAMQPLSEEEQVLLMQHSNTYHSRAINGNRGRGNRFDNSDRGRGRGRGRDETRMREQWDEGPRHRGGFDYGYDETYNSNNKDIPPSSHINRSLSNDNWRQQRLEDEPFLHKEVSKDKWGPRNWREGRIASGDTEGGMAGINPSNENRIFRTNKSLEDANQLPEWSTESVSTPGAFDADGAFLPTTKTHKKDPDVRVSSSLPIDIDHSEIPFKNNNLENNVSFNRISENQDVKNRTNNYQYRVQEIPKSINSNNMQIKSSETLISNDKNNGKIKSFDKIKNINVDDRNRLLSSCSLDLKNESKQYNNSNKLFEQINKLDSSDSSEVVEDWDHGISDEQIKILKELKGKNLDIKLSEINDCSESDSNAFVKVTNAKSGHTVIHDNKANGKKLNSYNANPRCNNNPQQFEAKQQQNISDDNKIVLGSKFSHINAFHNKINSDVSNNKECLNQSSKLGKVNNEGNGILNNLGLDIFDSTGDIQLGYLSKDLNIGKLNEIYPVEMTSKGLNRDAVEISTNVVTKSIDFEDQMDLLTLNSKTGGSYHVNTDAPYNYRNMNLTSIQNEFNLAKQHDVKTNSGDMGVFPNEKRFKEEGGELRVGAGNFGWPVDPLSLQQVESSYRFKHSEPISTLQQVIAPGPNYPSNIAFRHPIDHHISISAASLQPSIANLNTQNSPRMTTMGKEYKNYLGTGMGQEIVQSGGEIMRHEEGKSFADNLIHNCWFYKDPQNEIQGPFTDIEMDEWFDHGYFPMDLKIRPSLDGPFILLSELLIKCGKVPFDSKISETPILPKNSIQSFPLMGRPNMNSMQNIQNHDHLQNIDNLGHLKNMSMRPEYFQQNIYRPNVSFCQDQQLLKEENERRLKEAEEILQKKKKFDQEQEEAKIRLEMERQKFENELQRKQLELREIEGRAIKEAEQKAREAEQRARKEAELRIQREAELKALIEKDRRLLREAELKAQKEAEIRARDAELIAIKEEELRQKEATMRREAELRASELKQRAKEAELKREQEEEQRIQKTMELKKQEEKLKKKPAIVSASVSLGSHTETGKPNWKCSTGSNAPKSLLDIQLEQAGQMNEEVISVKPFTPVPKISEPQIWANANEYPKWASTNNKSNSIIDSQFPSLTPSADKSKIKKNNEVANRQKVLTKNAREEENVQRLFAAKTPHNELTVWCEKSLKGVHTNADIPTLIDLLMEVESPTEVNEYIRSYLGDSRQVIEFSQEFIEKRKKLVPSSDKEKNKLNTMAGAPNINKLTTTSQNKNQVLKTEATVNSKKGRKKMMKLDSNILGFKVSADPSRINAGEIDHVPPGVPK